MMPKKAPEDKRSHVIGVKVDTDTRKKIEYLAEMKAERMSTYIYNLLLKHIEEKEPWITKELEDAKKMEEG